MNGRRVETSGSAKNASVFVCCCNKMSDVLRLYFPSAVTKSSLAAVFLVKFSR